MSTGVRRVVAELLAMWRCFAQPRRRLRKLTTRYRDVRSRKRKPPRLRPGHAVQRRRQQAGGDGDERVCDAVRPCRRRGNISSHADDAQRFGVTMAGSRSGSASASPTRASDARRAAARPPPRLAQKDRWRAAGAPDFWSGPERERLR